MLHVFLKWSEYPDAFLCLHASAYSGHWQAEWIVLGRELELGRVQCGKQPLKVRYQEGYDHEYYIVSSLIDGHLKVHAKAFLRLEILAGR